MNKKKISVRNFFRTTIVLLLCFVMTATSSSLSVFSLLKTTASAEDETPGTFASGVSTRNLNFDKNWKFSLSDPAGAQYKAYDDDSWTDVTLPHDFSISQDFTTSGTETESGNLPGGTGWYRKMFVLPTNVSQKEFVLTFDGAYNNAYVYVNGEYVGENHYGYNAFSFDITDKLVCDGTTANLVAVKVESIIPSSRWYSGAGLYRDVTMNITDKVHVDLNGTKATTDNLASSNGSDGTVTNAVTVKNDSTSDKTITVKSSLFDAAGNEVGTSATSAATAVTAGSTATVTVSPTITNPTLWDSSNAYLYTLRTEILDGTTVIDTYDEDFGFRYFAWSATTGFSLNGTNTKLQGVCLHHDQGALGAAQDYDAIYRQISILKDMGCNAVRTSHGSASKNLIKVCNKLGIMVMEEFFDGWTSAKDGNTHDFSEYFSVAIATTTNKVLDASASETWAEFVVKQTVKRDRNDASVIMWSMGNELSEGTSGLSNEATTAANIRTWTLAEDSTRALTEGNNQSALRAADASVDVIGGNYHPSSWVSSRDTSKPFVGTETASSINSRGVYDITSGQSGYELTSYDNSAVSWGSIASDALMYTLQYDWFSGSFVWTGFDYIGEPTPWNGTGTGSSTVPNSSYFGIVDTAGFEKDSYYLYRSIWNTSDTTLHLLPGTWNQSSLSVDSSGYVNTTVYSNAKRVNLYLNGTLIGHAVSTAITTDAGYTYNTWTEYVDNSTYCKIDSPLYTGNGESLYSQFKVKYTAGTLSVKAYSDENGTTEITDTQGTNSVTSVSNTATQISTVISQKNYNITSDGNSYAYFELTAKDANGNFVNDYNGTVSVTLSGNGTIIGVDNGNEATTDKFQQSSVITSGTKATIQLYNGKALVIARTTEDIGSMTLSVTPADSGITAASYSVNTVEETDAEQVDEFEEVVDQSDLNYVATEYDKYALIAGLVNDLGEVGSLNEDTYTLYHANPTLTNIPSGTYIIRGHDDNATDGLRSRGVLQHSQSDSSGLNCDGSTGTPASTSDAWVFEQQTDGYYYVYYLNGDVKTYLNISSSALTTSTTAQEINVIYAPSTGTITLSDTGNSSYVNYYGGNASSAGYVGRYSSATSLTLYTVDGTTVSAYSIPTDAEIDDGHYVLYSVSKSAVMSVTAASTTGKLVGTTGTISGSILTTSDDNMLTITRVSGSTYYIQNAAGEYLNMGTSNTTLSFSSTAQALSVYARSDGRIQIYSGSEFIDAYSATEFSTWNPSLAAGTTNTNANEQLTLYSDVESTATSVSEAQTALYNALKDFADNYKAGTYTTASYAVLLEAVNAGYTVYNDTSSTDSDYTAATTAITNAIAALVISTKSFSSTLYKYGYSYTSTSTDYTSGGAAFNTQSIAEMKAKILATPAILNQIKTVIDYDGTSTTWGDDTYKETALDTAVAEYAKIYCLSFTDQGQNGSSKVSNFYASYWNIWAKANTQATTDTMVQGSSVQGLFSLSLDDNGLPTSHDAYSTALPYINDDNTHGLQSNVSVTLTTASGTTKSVTLTPLTDVSVYIPDLYSRTDMGSDGTVGTEGEGTYAKYYWDTDFPFTMTTDQYGVNHYKYDSADTSYLYQASFDDANHTAESTLNTSSEVKNWSINLSNNSSKTTGFFPFNYKTGVTSFTGENAIYHYGLNISSTFNLPTNGVYTGDEHVTFNFSGDDDVLFYIDGHLIIDNGGLHGVRTSNIDFADCSVTYQYLSGVDTQTVVPAGNGAEGITYTYGAANTGISDENQAAIDYLKEIQNDGKEHTFQFYFLERGSTESNCSINFNLRETSQDVKLVDQTLVADYGLPVEYNAGTNNTMSASAVSSQATVTYLGYSTEEIENPVNTTKPEGITEFDSSGTALTQAGKYGTFTINSSGLVRYTPNNMNFSSSDTIYLWAAIYNDPTFEAGTTYYKSEKFTVIPATTVYYEDDFQSGSGMTGGITYTDGKDGTTTGSSVYGTWVSMQNTEEVLQNADLVGSSAANVYGYDNVYATADTYGYSNESIHAVSVSDGNNSLKNSGGSWPKATFTFAGTGFDLVSITDSASGVIKVDVYKGTSATGTPVKRKVVDTCYGYQYGRVYADDSGTATLTADGNTTLYYTSNKNATPNVNYYQSDGTISTTVSYYRDSTKKTYTSSATYYDTDGNVTSTVTDSPAYAYAYFYAWLKDTSNTTNSLYQIPVIKIKDMDYGVYTVVITPTYSPIYGHHMTANNVNYYNFTLDAVRIYDPAGTGSGITDMDVSNGYKSDGEMNPNYLELRNMLIGADSFGSDSATQGIIFLDGNAQSDNDIAEYKKTGPNNELYLAKDQAVAFEIRASEKPVDIQIGAKLLRASTNTNSETTYPSLGLTYGSYSVAKQMKTSSAMYYSLNNLLKAQNGSLTWTQVTNTDGSYYYTTGTILLSNAGEDGTLLSITNLKWTFSDNTSSAIIVTPAETSTQSLELVSSDATVVNAMYAMAMTRANLTVADNNVTAESDTVEAGEQTVINITTSTDVYNLVITDADGNTIDPAKVESVVSEIDNENVKQWTVTLDTSEAGQYTYYITGEYENGYTDGSSPAEITVTVTAPPEAEKDTLLQRIKNFFEKLKEFFKTLLSVFSVSLY